MYWMVQHSDLRIIRCTEWRNTLTCVELDAMSFGKVVVIYVQGNPNEEATLPVVSRLIRTQALAFYSFLYLAIHNTNHSVFISHTHTDTPLSYAWKYIKLEHVLTQAFAVSWFSECFQGYCDVCKLTMKLHNLIHEGQLEEVFHEGQSFHTARKRSSMKDNHLAQIGRGLPWRTIISHS